MVSASLKDQAGDVDAPPVFRDMAHPVRHCHLSPVKLESLLSDANGYAVFKSCRLKKSYRMLNTRWADSYDVGEDSKGESGENHEN